MLCDFKTSGRLMSERTEDTHLKVALDTSPHPLNNPSPAPTPYVASSTLIAGRMPAATGAAPRQVVSSTRRGGREAAYDCNQHHADVISKARHVFDEVMSRRDGNTDADAETTLRKKLGDAEANISPSPLEAMKEERMGFGEDIIGKGNVRSGPRQRLQKQPDCCPRKGMFTLNDEEECDEHPSMASATASTPSIKTISKPSSQGGGANLSYLLNELRIQCPYLSASFTCAPADAVVLLNALSGAAGGAPRRLSDVAGGSGGETGTWHRVNYGHDLLPNKHDQISVGGGHSAAINVAAYEEKCSILEAEVRNLTARLERRSDECDKLKNEVAEARQRAKAIETNARQQNVLAGQRREEARKHLLVEEGRTAKLTHQNKLLQQELDRLKARLTSAMK